MSQFKRAQVVMLPTKEKINRILNLTLGNKIHLWNTNGTTYNPNPQHLYIISNDEIKEGDWFYNSFTKTTQTLKSNPEKVNNLKNCRKIIATTDVSLTLSTKTKYDGKSVTFDNYISLPQPSPQFIEKYIEDYNKGNIIKDILVEYEYFNNRWNIYGNPMMIPVKPTLDLKITSKDNTITIKKLKDSWNRGEMVELVTKALYEKGGWHQDEIDQWFKDNL